MTRKLPHVADTLAALAALAAEHTTTVQPGWPPVRILDLRSSWGQATRTGTHPSTAAHHRTQPWARASRDAYPHLHGILYVQATLRVMAVGKKSRPMRPTASAATTTLDALAGAMVFTVLIGNADAHAKNLSLLLDPPGTVRLAPCTTPCPPCSSRRSRSAARCGSVASTAASTTSPAPHSCARSRAATQRSSPKTTLEPSSIAGSTASPPTPTTPPPAATPHAGPNSY